MRSPKRPAGSKEISRFIANSPELAGIRACILSLQAGDRILRASSAPLSLPWKPRRGSMTTRAPAAVARSTVRSLDAPSTTMTSATPCATTEATTAPIASSSPRQGTTAETMSVTPGMIALIRQDTKPASQTPAQPAIGAGRGRPIRQERGAKRVVRRPVPDVLQALLGRVP